MVLFNLIPEKKNKYAAVVVAFLLVVLVSFSLLHNETSDAIPLGIEGTESLIVTLERIERFPEWRDWSRKLQNAIAASFLELWLTSNHSGPTTTAEKGVLKIQERYFELSSDDQEKALIDLARGPYSKYLTRAR